MRASDQSRSKPYDIEIRTGAGALRGLLYVPANPRGAILFAHGSGSSRLSTRNQFVASVLNHAGFATVLFDLLTEREAKSLDKVFDIELLAERLEDATIWQQQQEQFQAMPLGLFGASTGAAAALVAAARMPGTAAAVVSRGGRPDLAMAYLPRVKAPTLLIVGGSDQDVVDLNRNAVTKLRCEKELFIVPGATHLFPEPGALKRVAEKATEWFTRYL
ncbi:MAG TPA: alpha/beta hydrolase [Lacipirellulaceae bacterium]|nr:alpha/beta hydrolase [Lacipirellulaceae bacterium]